MSVRKREFGVFGLPVGRCAPSVVDETWRVGDKLSVSSFQIRLHL